MTQTQESHGTGWAAAPGRWEGGDLPDRVRLGRGTVVTGGDVFKRLRSRRDPALVIGANCVMDLTQFSYGLDGYIEVGDSCIFSNAVFMSELEILVGARVIIGWNSYVADSDFHPLAPLARIADTIACSPIGAAQDLPRPDVPCAPVVIEDDVWIGPACTILKGVRIGTGAFVEPGSLVSVDVPPRSRVMGNPGRVVGSV
jgi:acetyltransferase-like isoleucine patch superfamily enzyme